jgi:hypothetical protein
MVFRRLMTEDEVVDFLRLDKNKNGTDRKHPRRALWMLVRARKLNAVKIGRRFLFRPEDLTSFLERRLCHKAQVRWGQM